MEKHTAGATRAAEIIMNGQEFISTEYGKKRAAGIAELIDDKTAAPELLRAAKSAREDARMALADEWDKGNEGFEAMFNSLDAAIAKAEA